MLRNLDLTCGSRNAHKWVLLIDGIQGHQAAATMRHPQAAFRPLSDGIRGELPLPAPAHHASQLL